ncbi:hypothetical protein DA103_10280 [Enterobacter cloacae]|uniref:Uncharacterized protein n=1 Tax=Enterobacter cloacae TaxID=550 RepID=A0A2T4Y1V7_ENTCL|nr:hypothetical protein DA103_10280 [Enterobacter cloacae]RWS52914.1 hypothetical protein DN586_21295 [Enterobacter cloacae]RXW28517.1 hypothetical protein DM877_13635 [Enterobacter cloacae]TFF60825.1 hypothetical protein EIC82_05150 [Enterobacter sp. A11]
MSLLLNYSVLRKIIFLNKRCNPTIYVKRSFLLVNKQTLSHCDAYHKFSFSDPVLFFLCR